MSNKDLPLNEFVRERARKRRKTAIYPLELDFSLPDGASGTAVIRRGGDIDVADVQLVVDPDDLSSLRMIWDGQFDGQPLNLVLMPTIRFWQFEAVKGKIPNAESTEGDTLS